LIKTSESCDIWRISFNDLLSKEENISKEKIKFEKKVRLKCFIYKEIVSEERKKMYQKISFYRFDLASKAFEASWARIKKFKYSFIFEKIIFNWKSILPIEFSTFENIDYTTWYVPNKSYEGLKEKEIEKKNCLAEFYFFQFSFHCNWPWVRAW